MAAVAQALPLAAAAAAWTVVACLHVALVGADSVAAPGARMHTLFSVECNSYFDWQTVGVMHSYR